MKTQEKFPTIWDVPTNVKAAKASRAKETTVPSTPLKEVFLTIWDNAKRKPTA